MKRLPATLLSLALAAALSGAAAFGGAASSRAGGPEAPPPSLPRSTLSPDGGPSARPSTPLCFDLRNPASAYSTLSHIDPSIFRRHDSPLARLVSSLDLPTFTFDDLDGTPFVFSNDPATVAALDSALAENDWDLRNFPIPEEWPSSTRLYVQDADVSTNYPILFIPHDRHILLTDTPVVARIPDFLNALSALPSTIPAEGDIVLQITGDTLATLAGGGLFSSFARRNYATCTAGLGLDGDTAALQLVVAPIPCSGLDDGIAACGPISPATACVNHPGAIAFAARGPGPLLFPHEQNQPGELLCLFVATRSVAASVFPPVHPLGLPRMLGFMEIRPGHDDPAETRDGFLSLFSSHVFAIDTTTYRDFPLDTITVAAPDAFAAFLDDRLGPAGATAHAVVAQGLASGHMTLSTATLPDGHLVALNDADGTLLRAAIDALLDGGLSTRLFEQSPAFRAAFPPPDAPAHAIAHLDLSDLDAICGFSDLGFLPLLGIPLSSNSIPSPCPIDLFAYIASDSSLVTRLRAPVPLLHSLAAPDGGPSARQSSPSFASCTSFSSPSSPAP